MLFNQTVHNACSALQSVAIPFHDSHIVCVKLPSQIPTCSDLMLEPEYELLNCMVECS